MMRITRVPGTDGVARLSIEGRLAEAEVTELATSCEAYLAARHPLLLDLSGVTFVGARHRRLRGRLQALDLAPPRRREHRPDEAPQPAAPARGADRRPPAALRRGRVSRRGRGGLGDAERRPPRAAPDAGDCAPVHRPA